MTISKNEKNKPIYLRGKIWWAKIFDEPRPAYARPGTQPSHREWTFEFEPLDLEAVRDAGLEHKLKTGRKKDGSIRKGYEDRKPFMAFHRKEFNRKGEKNEHIRVVDSNREPWPDNVKLGNETIVDVKFNFFPDEGGDPNFDSLYAKAIRVLDLVPYQSADFEPLPEDDEYRPRDTFKEDFGITIVDEESDDGEAEPAPKRGRPKKTDLNDEVPV